MGTLESPESPIAPSLPGSTLQVYSVGARVVRVTRAGCRRRGLELEKERFQGNLCDLY